MLIADREISLLVVTLGSLRQAQNALVVRRGLFEIRASKPDIPKLKNLGIENSRHDLLPQSAVSTVSDVRPLAQPLTALDRTASASAAGFCLPSGDALLRAWPATAVRAPAASQAGSDGVLDWFRRIGEGTKSARASVTFWPM